MNLRCALFGHKRLCDDWIHFHFGNARYSAGVCVRCGCMILKPANDRARVIEWENS